MQRRSECGRPTQAAAAAPETSTLPPLGAGSPARSRCRRKTCTLSVLLLHGLSRQNNIKYCTATVQGLPPSQEAPSTGPQPPPRLACLLEPCRSGSSR